MGPSPLLDVLAMTTIVVATLLALHAVIRTPALGRWLPIKGGKSRIDSLEGLRGLLALAVVFTHARSFWREAQGYGWGYPESRLLKIMGQEAVMLFFALTAFLFWNKILRGSPIRAWDFYRDRAKRLLPMAYVAAALTLAFALAHGRGHWPEFGGELRTNLAALLMPGFRPAGTLNGLNGNRVFGQTWTLWYEILFSVAFPVLALLARRVPKAIPVALILVILTVLILHRTAFFPRGLAIGSFGIGIVAATLFTDPSWRARLQGPLASVVVLASLASTLLLADAQTWVVLPALLTVFVPIAYGNDLFGLLSRPACRLLGAISYSVYLLHTFVLSLALSAVSSFTEVRSLSNGAFWAVVAAVVAGTVPLSLFTFKSIEERFSRPQRPGPPLRYAVFSRVRRKSTVHDRREKGKVSTP